jgi:Patatin-like phospholipase
MPDPQTDKPAFHIGIAMAGAVSAGAYSAGVFDFLMEALSEWQKAKERGDNVPKHDVFISAISGTSAGGITAALGLASLAGGIRSVEEPSANPKQTKPVRRALPELYDVWVKKTRLFGARKDGGESSWPASNSALLDTGDIKPGDLPASLLNSEALTRIARESISSIHPTGKKLAFFTNPTHLFLTHTNLDGIPYPIAFEEDVYWMSLHEDRAHFAVAGVGQRPFPQNCRWLTTWNDPGDPIDFGELGTLAGTPADRALKEPFESLCQAALTTSAFPFGLKARQISVETANIRRRAMPFDAGEFPATLAKQAFASGQQIKRANFVCVDGGTMNNEPFELVRWTIRDLDESQNSRSPKTANRAVILIAPFPPQSTSNFDLLARPRDLAMGFVGKTLLPALIDQARFKASDLIAASDPKVYSRYLISPTRLKDSKKPALACGLLYAFGGFLDEQFREHDFQLGRRNCQWFLRKHFTLHPSNLVFGREADPTAADGAEHAIIPLVGTANVPIDELPLWPTLSRSKLAELRAALQRRLDALVPSFVAQLLKSFTILRIAARLSWRRRREEVIRRAMQIIEKELMSTEQLEPVPPPDYWARFRDRLGFGRSGR